MFKAMKAVIGWKKKKPKDDGGKERDQTNDSSNISAASASASASSSSSVAVDGTISVTQRYTPTCGVCKNVDLLEVPVKDNVSFEYECSNCHSIEHFRRPPVEQQQQHLHPPPQHQQQPGFDLFRPPQDQMHTKSARNATTKPSSRTSKLSKAPPTGTATSATKVCVGMEKGRFDVDVAAVKGAKNPSSIMMVPQARNMSTSPAMSSQIPSTNVSTPEIERKEKKSKDALLQPAGTKCLPAISPIASESSSASFEIPEIGQEAKKAGDNLPQPASAVGRESMCSVSPIVSESSYAIKALDVFGEISGKELMEMNKDELLGKIKEMDKEEIVEVIMTVCARDRTRSAPEISTSPGFRTGVSPATIGAIPIVPHATRPKMIAGSESKVRQDLSFSQLSGKESADYQRLSRLSVRLLKTMCSKTSKSIPAEKHEMIMYLLKNPVISKQVEVVARPDPVVAKQMEAEQFERKITDTIEHSESAITQSRSDDKPLRIGVKLRTPPNETENFENIQEQSFDLSTLDKAVRRALENVIDEIISEVPTEVKPRMPFLRKGRSSSAPARTDALSSNERRRISIKEELPKFSLAPNRRQSIVSPHYFEQSLNIDDLPRSTKEFQAYARLSKLSDAELQQTVMDAGLFRYKFRSPHEIKMALVSKGNTGRSRTPLTEEWRKKTANKVRAEQLGHFHRKEHDIRDDEFDSLNDTQSHSSLSSDDTEKYQRFRQKQFTHRSIQKYESAQNRDLSPRLTAPAVVHSSSGYYYKNKLTTTLPTKTIENIEYGKLAKYSDRALDKELQNYHLDSFKFRNAHESIMAIISKKVKHTVRRKSNYQLADESIQNGLMNSRSKNGFPRGSSTQSLSLLPNTPHTLSKVPEKSDLLERTLDFLANQSLSRVEPATNQKLTAFARDEWPYFFKSKLTTSIPTNTKQNLQYGKYARMSSLGLDAELARMNASKFKFRNDHEKMMAMISINFNTMISMRSFGVDIGTALKATPKKPLNIDIRPLGRDINTQASSVGEGLTPSTPKLSQREELLGASVSEIATRLRGAHLSPEKFAYNKSKMIEALLHTEKNRIAELFRKKKALASTPL